MEVLKELWGKKPFRYGVYVAGLALLVIVGLQVGGYLGQ